MASKQSEPTDMTVAEVAKALGTTPVNVLLFIKRGLLEGLESEDGWVVASKSFAAFRASEAGHVGRASCRSACSKAGGCGSCE
ncbi:MAG: hypothetical protein K8R55_10195 [Desulfuromonadaceae bacterium]|nr:hypothetical protein [Desulfuromonadaceae bacterium]